MKHRRRNKGAEILDTDFLLDAYRHGYFPMADGKDGEIYWFSPEQRGVFPLDRLKISRSLRHTLRKKVFTVRVNTDFETVIRRCADREETWISEPIVQTYLQLHRCGFAHSVESWSGTTLAGGLYGVAIGGAFFGESMFSIMTDASKASLVSLVERLRERHFTLLDTQFLTPHLESLGAVEIPKKDYLAQLEKSLHLHCEFADRKD